MQCGTQNTSGKEKSFDRAELRVAAAFIQQATIHLVRLEIACPLVTQV